MAAELEKQEIVVDNGNCVEGKEEEKLVKMMDFDMLCSRVAMQTNYGKWRELNVEEGEDDDLEYGGLLRMWEGGVLDCFDDRSIALQSACCPCFRFGANMRRAGFGSCFTQGLVYMILLLTALINISAYIITNRHCFLYMAAAFIIFLGSYLGFYRTQIRKKFNITNSDTSLDDCVYHIICPCCTLSQEARTLEMNNVQDGIWNGRGDTICIGSYNENSKTFLDQLTPSPVFMSTKSNMVHSTQKSVNISRHSWNSEDGDDSDPLVTNITLE